MTSSRGFTLLEVLVALAVLATVVAGLAVALESRVDAQLRLEKRSAAAQLAWNLMEEYRLDPALPVPGAAQGRQPMGRWTLDWARRVVPAGDRVLVEIGVRDGARVIHVERWSRGLP